MRTSLQEKAYRKKYRWFCKGCPLLVVVEKRRGKEISLCTLFGFFSLESKRKYCRGRYNNSRK
jgi:hypothetical protein